MDTRLWEQLKDWKENCEFIDLSHPLSPETPHWSGFPAMKMKRLFDYPDGFMVNEFCIVSQYGTHADAPSHFVEGTPGLDSVPAKDLLLPLCVVDVSDKVANDVDYAVTKKDITDWEETYGKIPDKCFVAIRTDWSQRDDLDNCDAEGNKHYPGWSMEALKFLVEERDVTAVGHETSDTDTAVDAAAHGLICEYYILEQERYQIELMRDLCKVPPVGALIFCGFPKAVDAAGFTARCVAICPKK